MKVIKAKLMNQLCEMPFFSLACTWCGWIGWCGECPHDDLTISVGDCPLCPICGRGEQLAEVGHFKVEEAIKKRTSLEKSAAMVVI
ncbi:MAG: hypothetical protein AB1352_03550 [Patescibacteria group bacterium]